MQHHAAGEIPRQGCERLTQRVEQAGRDRDLHRLIGGDIADQVVQQMGDLTGGVTQGEAGQMGGKGCEDQFGGGLGHRGNLPLPRFDMGRQMFDEMAAQQPRRL